MMEKIVMERVRDYEVESGVEDGGVGGERFAVYDGAQAACGLEGGSGGYEGGYGRVGVWMALVPTSMVSMLVTQLLVAGKAVVWEIWGWREGWSSRFGLEG